MHTRTIPRSSGGVPLGFAGAGFRKGSHDGEKTIARGSPDRPDPSRDICRHIADPPGNRSPELVSHRGGLWRREKIAVEWRAAGRRFRVKLSIETKHQTGYIPIKTYGLALRETRGLTKQNWSEGQNCMCAPGRPARWRLWRAIRLTPGPGRTIFHFRLGGFLCDDRPKGDGPKGNGEDAVKPETPCAAVPRGRRPRRSALVRASPVRACVFRRHGMGRVRHLVGVDPANLPINRIGDLARCKRHPFLIRTGSPHSRIGLLEHRISHCEIHARGDRKQSDPRGMLTTPPQLMHREKNVKISSNRGTRPCLNRRTPCCHTSRGS